MRLEYYEMLETVEAMDVDAGTITASSTLPTESPIFDGHFPHFPVLPGTMMLEIMGHAVGYLVFVKLKRQRFVFLGAVKRAKFRRFVEPGAKLTMQGKLTHDGSGFFVAETKLIVNGEVAADAEIVMIVTDFPTEALKQESVRRFGEVRVLSATDR